MARQFLKVTVKKIDGRDVSQHVRLLPIKAVKRVQPVLTDANDSEVFYDLQGVIPTKLTVDETVNTLAGQIPAGFKLRISAVWRGSTKNVAAVDTLLTTPNILDVRAATGAGATATSSRTEEVVTGITVTNQGQEYTDGATVTISGGAGSGATAVPVVQNGKIVAITVTAGGSGYTSNPTVTINPGSKVRTREQGVHYEEYLVTNTIAALETQLTP